MRPLFFSLLLCPTDLNFCHFQKTSLTSTITFSVTLILWPLCVLWRIPSIDAGAPGLPLLAFLKFLIFFFFNSPTDPKSWNVFDGKRKKEGGWSMVGGDRGNWGAGMAQWWEHSPSTNVARVRFPDSTSYVGWVCCWFSSLLWEVFLRVLRFSPLRKNQHF